MNEIEELNKLAAKDSTMNEAQLKALKDKENEIEELKKKLNETEEQKKSQKLPPEEEYITPNINIMIEIQMKGQEKDLKVSIRETMKKCKYLILRQI